MYQYDIGDRVLVRDDLIDEEAYDGCTFVYQMLEWSGKVVTISHRRNLWGVRYSIIEDDGEWSWSEPMFVSLVEDECKKEISPDALLEVLSV